MKCMNCGAELTESAYCPNCGCDVSVQKQAIVLSGLYYNQGLEKAEVRDLSGAIDMLRRSLKFNKLNISARNLLGLVYFEMGEVVAALSEWVISKNIQPDDNIAVEYIENLQKDANRLDVINQTIKKYNLALENCYNGNEDVAMIQLKKILAQNPKLIKGYHLLSLLYIKNGEYEKARKLLKKAVRIDKTNTTTLRFLQEVDEQTGLATTLEPRFSIWGAREKDESGDSALVNAGSVQTVHAFRETNVGATVFNLLAGVLIGAAAIWFLFMPARTKAIRDEANQKIASYSSNMAVDEAQVAALRAEIEQSQETVDTANARIDEANTKATTYENLIKAVNAFNNGATDQAANALGAVDVELLSVEAKAIYDTVSTGANLSLLGEYKAMGIAAFGNGDYATAVTNLEMAKSIDPTDYETLDYLAHAYRFLGDTANADAAFQFIIDTFPNTARAENARMFLSWNQGGGNSNWNGGNDWNAEAEAAAQAAQAAEAEAAAAAQAAADQAAQQAAAEAAQAAANAAAENPVG